MAKKFLSLTLAMLLLVTLCSCKDEKSQPTITDPVSKPTETVGKDPTGYLNDETPIIFSSQEVDKVFNPFFSTSAADSNVIGMTQIGMLGNDKDGKVTYGNDEPVVVLDYAVEDNGGTKDVDLITTYYFVLKNDIKFSNGSPLTMKDVLFNLYVYLDPLYTGSSTIYSTDIVGLDAYRTQELDEEEQESFRAQFEVEASERIDSLVMAAQDIFKYNHDAMTVEEFKTILEGYGYEHAVSDFDKACELFEEELESDYSNSIDSYTSITFKDAMDRVYKNLLTTDVEAFLYNEGYISWNKDDAKLESSLTNNPSELKTWTKEKAIKTILEDKLPYDIVEIVSYWNTSLTLREYLINEAISAHFNEMGEYPFPNISGIKFINRQEPVEVNGVRYDVPTYDDNGAVNNGTNEVLAISINNVDPKAIWNFAFSVAPMYYYSNAEQIELFDYEKHFGVDYSSSDFMDNVVKDPNKIGVPVGAGPYVASKASGGTKNVTSGDFYDKGVIYFERNEHYLMGAPKIKRLRYQVVSETRMMDALQNSEIDFVQPNAKPETINDLEKLASKGFGHKSVQTMGYGYIGINAAKVPTLKVRQAIMHAINTKMTVDYYGTTAKPIYRGMSLSSWAYPEEVKNQYYPYVGKDAVIPELDNVNPDYADYIEEIGKKPGDTLTDAEGKAFLRRLVEDAGYKLNGNGVYQSGNNVLKYTFTVAGEEVDHPAWQALYNAGEILNDIGFEITVTTDANALKKLSQGQLTVWAAAWGSTIDPDMYQVYHRDSQASSTKNWGYDAIKANIGGKYDEEVELLADLSDLIDRGRETLDENERKQIYERALELVMQMAIELPTYQRDDLFAYNINKIDANTLTPDAELSSFNGLTSKIWTISLNE